MPSSSPRMIGPQRGSWVIFSTANFRTHRTLDWPGCRQGRVNGCRRAWHRPRWQTPSPRHAGRARDSPCRAVPRWRRPAQPPFRITARPAAGSWRSSGELCYQSSRALPPCATRCMPAAPRSPQIVGVAGWLHLADDAAMSTIEQNKTVVGDFIDGLFTKGDLSAVDTYLAENFVNHDPPFGSSADREGMRAAGAMFRAAFPDWHSEAHLLVGEDDIVVEHFTASGTHRGEIMGVAPSGREVSLRGINIFRVRDGRIVERWGR